MFESTSLVDSDININAPPDLRRSIRVRQLPPNLNDYVIVPDIAVDSESELVHYVLMAEAEPIYFEREIPKPKWGSILRNKKLAQLRRTKHEN